MKLWAELLFLGLLAATLAAPREPDPQPDPESDPAPEALEALEDALDSELDALEEEALGRVAALLQLTTPQPDGSDSLLSCGCNVSCRRGGCSCTTCYCRCKCNFWGKPKCY